MQRLPAVVANELEGVDLSYMSESQNFRMLQFFMPPTSLYLLIFLGFPINLIRLLLVTPETLVS